VSTVVIAARATGIASRMSIAQSISSMGATGLAPDASIPSLALDFTTGSLDSRITFARADATTCATYFGSDGLLKTAAANIPRFDYDPVTLTPNGLLIEESRVNNETNASAAGKGVAGDTVTTGQASPDGATNAILHLADGTSATHWINLTTLTPTLNNTYSVSVFLKAGTGSLVQVAVGSAHSGATVYCNYNLSTASMTAGAGIVASSNFCTSIGNGWYRCGFSYVASATASGTGILTCVITSMAQSRLPVTTANTSYYRFGGQYESTATMGSAAFPTSYIPTTTTSLTRAADSASMTGTNFSSWWNATEGTFVLVGDINGRVAATYPSMLGVGTSTDRFTLYPNGTTGYVFSTRVAGSDTAAPYVNRDNNSYSIAAAYTTNNVNAAFNGTLGTLDTVCAMPSASQLYFGGIGGNAVNTQHISRLIYWPKRLPDATLKALTA